MLDICSNYATEYSISFNANKGKCIICRPTNDLNSDIDDNRYNFVLGGHRIDMVRKWPHLGNIIDSTQKDNECIIHRRHKLIGQINDTLCSFRSLQPSVKLELLNTYCSSIYGSVLWNIDNVEIQRVCSIWRSAVKRILGLPYRAHNYLVSNLCSKLPIYDELCRRTVSFINMCVNSGKKTVRQVSEHGIFYGRAHSLFELNVICLCNRY
jgi:hypothetical protein